MDIMEVYKAPPKRVKDDEGKNLQLAAAAMGLVAAAAPMVGLPMLAAGAGVGAAGAGLYSATRKGPKQPTSPDNVGYSESTVGRRVESMKADPMQDLMAARQALEQAPLSYEEKLDYMRPLNQAMEKYKTRYG